MQTILDSLHDIQLNGYKYDGINLVAEVTELLVAERVIGRGGPVVPGMRKFQIVFESPLAHVLTEEFPAAVAGLLSGSGTGFLRKIENSSLRTILGLDIDQFAAATAYALVTAHEVLVVYSTEAPWIFKLGPAYESPFTSNVEPLKK